MNPTIRDARATDLEAIITIARAGAIEANRYAPLDLDDPRYRQVFDIIDRDPNHRLIVVESEGEVVGTLFLSFLPDLMGPGQWRGQLENVHVRADHRGKGLGGMLIEWAIGQCRERNCTFAQLTSNKKRSDAHRFYERLGFERSHDGFKLKL